MKTSSIVIIVVVVVILGVGLYVLNNKKERFSGGLEPTSSEISGIGPMVEGYKCPICD
jgi:hypothetical protein